MTASRPTEQPAPPVFAGVSMRDLLASCAAADVISRPPREPEPRESRRDERPGRAA